MNEDNTDEVILLDQIVVDADDLVDAEPVDDDDYEPTEEVILLDMATVDDDDLLDVA